MVSSRVAVPFVVVYMTAGFIMEALFVGVRLATVAQPTAQTRLIRMDEILTRHSLPDTPN